VTQNKKIIKILMHLFNCWHLRLLFVQYIQYTVEAKMSKEIIDNGVQQYYTGCSSKISLIAFRQYFHKTRYLKTQFCKTAQS